MAGPGLANADPQPPARRVVTTEFGQVVLEQSSRASDTERCWRCDVPPQGALDDIGLCRPCGRELRAGG